MDYRREELLPGVWLTALRTGKFKTGTLTLTLLSQLDAETASMHALIPSVLRRGTVSLPDMESIASRLDSLYGAQAESAVRRVGEVQCSGFFSSFPEDRLLPERASLLRQVSALLGELLLRPNTRGGLLLPDYVNSERDKLCERIRAQKNDKDSYAVQRLVQLMCPCEAVAAGTLGSEESAEAIHYTKLTRRWRELTAAAPIELFYCGSEGFEAVSDALAEALTGLPRGELDADIGTDVRMNAMESAPREFTDHMDVTQGKLAMGWRLGESMEEPDIPALLVFNAVFGGSVTSKLFMNVRERLQLCYYASSGLDWQKGLLLVSSGVAFDKLGAARDEIFAQLEAMKRGEVTAEELEAARLSVRNRYASMGDDPFALESHYLSMNIAGSDASPEDIAAACDGVTAEDVVRIAQNTDCDAIYYLKAGEGKSDDDQA